MIKIETGNERLILSGFTGAVLGLDYGRDPAQSLISKIYPTGGATREALMFKRYLQGPLGLIGRRCVRVVAYRFEETIVLHRRMALFVPVRKQRLDFKDVHQVLVGPERGKAYGIVRPALFLELRDGSEQVLGWARSTEPLKEPGRVLADFISVPFTAGLGPGDWARIENARLREQRQSERMRLPPMGPRGRF